MISANQNSRLDSRLNMIVTRIKKLGYSLTPQRLEIIKIISESKSHPSAIDVYKKVRELYPMVSLNTVYKNLSLLASLHEVKEIKTLQNSVHYDGDISDHGHAICERCGKIIDVDIESIDIKNSFKSGMKKNLLDDFNFSIRNFGVEFYGVCGVCAEENIKAEAQITQ